MSIKLNLYSGFEKLLDEIESANGSMEKATDAALRQSAQIMQSELKAEMRDANVPSDLINEMPPFEVEKNGNEFSAKVGYKKGNFDPDNLSTGYKIVMLNYGTPHRKVYGQIHEGSTMKAGGTLKLGFIQRAKEKAQPKIRKAQKQALNKILERLKK